MKSSPPRRRMPRTSETTVPDEKLWIVLRRAYHAITERLENGVTARGMPVSEFIVLEVLLHNGSLTVPEISRKTRLAAASAETTITRLEKQELISQQQTPGDGHPGKTKFDLTEQGRSTIEWLYGEHVQDIESILHVLPDERRFELYQSLREVGHHAESSRTMPTVNPGGGLTPWQLRRAMEFMRRRMAQPITTTEIATSIELSDSHFRRAFKSATGVTPYNWLLSLRIGEAQKLLQEGVVPLSEIATAVGFGDQSHFSRMFQKVIGVSPRVWQRDHHLR